MTLLQHQPLTHFPEPVAATAPAPPEARGMDRDEVRLLVARPTGVVHTDFRDLPEHLDPGDLVVVNNTATVPGEIDAVRDGDPVVLHLAPGPDATWLVELRTAPDAARAVLDARPGMRITVGGIGLTLLSSHPHEGSSPTGEGNRIWRASADGDLGAVLTAQGRPIAYGYLHHRYPLKSYQTIFAARPGSAEMASAGRPFSGAVLARLVGRGVLVATVTLHTGFSSQEAGEAPTEEWFEVPAATARLVNATREAGRRVIAVGTTVTRALESAAASDGHLVATSGWTDRVISPHEPARVATGLVTGWHDPQASHLLLVESIAGPALTQAAYDAAVAEGYLWHEFGDSALLLP